MRVAQASILSLLLPAISARFVEDNEPSHVELNPEAVEAEKFHIELSPGDSRWVTEEEKWELRRSGQRFMDITENADLGTNRLTVRESVFPDELTSQKDLEPLLKSLSKSEMKDHLTKFTGFHTRYYKSDYGRQSSEWLLSQVRGIIKDAGADENDIKAEHFEHSWGQNSIIARIPGKTNSTIVVGAHQDSINLWIPSVLSAPGADDDGSGTVTILEAFRVFLMSEEAVKGEMENTVEFHWYSAEEGGLLGSQAIFSEYEKNERDVKAMLQQDMTGFVSRTEEAGEEESVGVIIDYVDPNLTDFIKKVIVEYCSIPYVETKCGYACSDHASASKAGYPSAFVIESKFEFSDDHIHTSDDSIEYLSFDHMLQHARMTLAFVYELATTDFKALDNKNEVVDEL